MRKVKKYLNKKSIVVLAVLLGIAILPALGSETDYSTMDLEDVKDMVVKGNLDIMEANQEVSMARNARTEANENERTRGTTTFETYKNRRYYPDKADADVDYAIWSADEVEQETILNAVEDYYAYNLKEREIRLALDNIELLNTELVQITRKLELGRATEFDKTSQELVVSQAEYALSLLYNERESLGWELKKMMNISLDSNVRFEALAIPTVDYDATNLEEDIDDTLEKNGEVIKARAYYDLALELVDIADDAGYDDRDSVYMNAEDGVAAAELSIQESLLNTEYDIRSEYNNMLNAVDDVTIKTLDSEKAKMQWDTLQRKYELGLATELDANKAKQTYDESLLAVEQAKLDAYIEYLAFLNLFE